MNKKVIVFNHVSKYFNLNRDKSLKSKFINSYKKETLNNFLAINDVTFEIKRGESVGLWGENGSGKSTILKLISGLYLPNQGKVTVKGSVASVLELGVGLHPELTGRENIFFYSSVLNIPHSIILNNFKEIVDFFGFEKFLDVPVKRYSSGMKSRLAFSIAAFSNADILLFDEVMAVGDLDFKERAMDKINQLRKEKTIIFTSHSYSVVQQLCDRMLTFHEGKIVRHSNSKMVKFLKNLNNGVEIKAEAMSNSMSPSINKGDIVNIKKINYKSLKIGDIVAFIFSNLDQMIIHRVVAKRILQSGKVKFFTRGDFSHETDPWVLSEKEYLGKVMKIQKNYSVIAK